VGTKFSKNDYSDYEIQPNARLLWHPREKQTVWASVSRAVRVPSRVDHDIENLFVSFIPGSPLNTFITAQGDNGIDSETLIAYELGYRIQPNDNISLDVAAFYNDYDKLIVGTARGTPFLDTSFPTPFLSVPISGDNDMNGETFGIEVSARLQVLEWWRLQSAYSYIKMNLHPKSGANLPNTDVAEGETPRNQFSLNSSFDLPKDVEFDVFFRYVDNLPALNIDSYVEANIRLGWKPTEDLEISFVARNLLDKRHAEFQDTTASSGIITEMERSYYAQIVWKFW
jgi:iron complex outermembrane receptor protein